MSDLKSTSKISTPQDYETQIRFLEALALKGDSNLTNEEVELIQKTAEMIAEFEENNGMVPIQRNAIPKGDLTKEEITSILGYEPDLIGMIEFKMFQLKLNRAALANMLKMTPSKISQILNKKRDPDLDFLRAIHMKLGIDGNLLLEYA